MQFSPFALPAIIALLAKAGMFFYARHSKVHNVQTRLYLLFLFSLSIQNLVEINLFFLRSNNVSTPYGGALYFSVSIAAIAFLLHLALVMALNWRDKQNDNLPRLGFILIYAPPIVLETLLWTTPLLVAGLQPIGYTYTKIPGPLYFLFELYALGYLCAAAGLFVYGAYTQAAPSRRLQNKLLLAGLFPIVALVTVIVSLQRFGFSGFNTTATLPIATTFFLAVTAYATHQCRLFDIEFFIPWSKLRRRKTAFYERIKAVIAEIADMSSVSRIVQSLSAALHCPVVLMGGPKPALAMAGDAFAVARFPLEELKKVEQIIVAQEIGDKMPSMYTLMKRHKVAAIVPFHPHSEAAASWMLLGESFSQHVYTPLDFQVVETLFARLADRFLDKQLVLREQLCEAQREMRVLHERLATAWGQLDETRRRLRSTETKYWKLQWKSLAFGTDLQEFEAKLSDQAANGVKTLDEQNAAFEARLIERVLDRCDWDFDRAAELLGLSRIALRHKLIHHGLLEHKK